MRLNLNPELTETLTRLADESDELWCGRIGDNIRLMLADEGKIPDDLITSIHLDSSYMVDVSYPGRQVCDIQEDVRRLLQANASKLGE